MTYLGEVVSSAFSIIFFIAVIAALGYLVGGIHIKGVSLGTAGVLLVALIFGVVASYVPSFEIGGSTISLYNDALAGNFRLVSQIGTAFFVTSIGLIAGPKFFRTFNKKSISYILMGIIVIVAGALAAVLLLVVDPDLSAEMAAGILTGALTSTPGLSAAQESAAESGVAEITAGYGIAYVFGVLGVVLFVQIIPKLLRVNVEKERESFQAANVISVKPITRKLTKLDPFGAFAFFLAIFLGCLIGSIKIPGINFSLGTSGGTLISGLIVGHFGHLFGIDCRINKETLQFFRELGLVLFLVGAGVPGGVSFMENIALKYFLYGVILTLVPMIVGFVVAKYIFKLSIFNNLGSITGGMTSTPALDALIRAAGTDEVSSAYAATYPIALVSVVLAAKIIVMVF